MSEENKLPEKCTGWRACNGKLEKDPFMAISGVNSQTGKKVIIKEYKCQDCGKVYSIEEEVKQ